MRVAENGGDWRREQFKKQMKIEAFQNGLTV